MSKKVTYRQQFTRCGKPSCRTCKETAGHGPYWYAYWCVDGRTVSKYLGKNLAKVEVETSSFQQRDRLVEAAVHLASPRSPNGQAEKEPFVEPASLTIPNSLSPNRKGLSDKQPVLRIYVLGQFSIARLQGEVWQTIDTRMWQRRRARALLGCLLSNTGRRVGREQVMEALWPDLERETAANRLNGAVHEVRRILEPALERPAASQLLRLERDVLQLANADRIWVDADIFEGLLKQAHGLSNPAQAEQMLDEAARLYGGDYLLEDLYAEWAAPRREALRRGWIGLLLNLAEMRAARGELTGALEALERLLASDPLHETGVRRMMLLLAQLDRRGEALDVYHRLANNLQLDDESDPLPETIALYEALRQGSVEVPNTVASQATTILAEVQHEQHSPPVPEIPQQVTRTFPRLVFQLGRQNPSLLVGREQELAIMRRHLYATDDVSLKQGQKVSSGEIDPPVKGSAGDLQKRPRKQHFLLLLGEAGIGKTRLAEELCQEANAQGWSVAWAQAQEQERNTPFRLWTLVLRTMLQDVPISPLSSEQERLHSWETTSELLSALSRVTPLLIVLDDLHWTDDSSLELLAYLVRYLQDEPMLLVGTCRDVELMANSNLRTLINDLRREQNIVTLSLQPLTQAQIGSIVAHLPKDLAQSIQILADGNPFFAEELARASEPALLSRAGPASEVGHALQFNVCNEGVPMEINHGVRLPETIAAILERRLSNLSHDCLALLGKASVIGNSFEFNQLLLMTGDKGQTEDAILDLLEEALSAGLLTEERTGTSITYHFRGLVYLHQALDLFSDSRASIDQDWVERILANLEHH